ncbi:MAG TPA: nucleoside triphosphate pyrophosphohydrolase [Kofleriaceae bacterium]|nr:nucleoside triphosphate pyrophosphohydrolase [Kofleriaceae bacterium]
MSSADLESKTGAKVADLCAVMARLLAPDGCPWDREQSLESLRPYVLEEAYEVVDAIDRGSVEDHREELGDLLLQIVFQAAVRQAEGAFTLDDVVAGIVAKLVRRHPHVFADAEAATAGDVARQWEEIKAEEKRGRPERAGVLAGVPVAMPALSRAQQISRRAAGVGFDWPDVGGCRAKVEEELAEVACAQAAGDSAHIEAEVGDLLFAAVSLARKSGVDAESALRAATRKFEQRFAFIERRLTERGSSPKASTLEEMDALWNEAKSRP